MKALKPFNIAFVALSNGEHEFSFELNDDFFACFEQSEIVKSKLTGKLVLDKKSNMMDLHFIISGQVELQCDRCLEPFWYDMNLQRSLYIKFGERLEEQSDDVIIIPATESHIEVGGYFYEFAILGIPVKKVHEEDDKGNQQCDPLILKQLEKYMPHKGDNTEQDNNDKPSDSRWDALKNIKFN